MERGIRSLISALPEGYAKRPVPVMRYLKEISIELILSDVSIVEDVMEIARRTQLFLSTSFLVPD
jgi:hypothetical protein